jgi:hypothetical protein
MCCECAGVGTAAPIAADMRKESRDRSATYGRRAELMYHSRKESLYF